MRFYQNLIYINRTQYRLFNMYSIAIIPDNKITHILEDIQVLGDSKAQKLKDGFDIFKKMGEDCSIVCPTGVWVKDDLENYAVMTDWPNNSYCTGRMFFKRDSNFYWISIGVSKQTDNCSSFYLASIYKNGIQCQELLQQEWLYKEILLILGIFSDYQLGIIKKHT